MTNRFLTRGRLTRILRPCLAALVLLFACVPAEAQGARARQKEVKIYLVNSVAEYDAKNPLGLHPVARKVDRRSPMRGALAALVAGPTEAESGRGLMGTTYGIRFLTVKLKGGVAYTHFTLPEGAGFPGDLAPSIFKEAVTKTVKQFPGVRRAVVCLDGDENFGDWGGESAKKCPKV